MVNINSVSKSSSKKSGRKKIGKIAVLSGSNSIGSRVSIDKPLWDFPPEANSMLKIVSGLFPLFV